MRNTLQRLGIAFSLTLLTSTLLLVLLSGDPASAIAAFWLRVVSSRTSFLNMLELAAPLMVCSLGALLAFRSGHFNLGGEGQLYAGACTAALAGVWLADLPLTLPVAVWLYPVLVLLAGMAGGLLAALIPALGRRLAGADILLTSFLISQAAIVLVDSLIAGPLRNTANNLVAMRPVSELARLARLARPSALTLAPVLALAACLLLWLYLERSRQGRMLTLYGKNREFATLMGYPVKAFAWLPVLAAGALHGLGGSFLVQGVNGTAVRGMSGGLGWSAIGVALIANNKPAALPLAVLLFAWLDAGARHASVLADVPVDIAAVVKALVVIGITARPLWPTARGKLFKGERL